jgi:flagellar hook-basal body complex protein FliE
MDIKANSLYQEMQAMAGMSGMDIAQRQSLQTNSSSSDFANMLGDALNTVNGLQIDSRTKSKAFEIGDPNLSLADVMVAKEKSGIAFEATVQVRNKVLEAYKQIMNMPV